MALLEVDTLIVVTVALFVIVMAVTTFAFKLWPFISKLNQIAEDWTGEKARSGVSARPGIMERMQVIEEKAEDAAYNSKPNRGHSAHDTLMQSIDKLSRQVEDVSRHVSESQKDRINLWGEIKKLQERNNGN